jgi:hypothetical protein
MDGTRQQRIPSPDEPGLEGTKGSRLPCRTGRPRTEYITFRLPSKEYQEGKVLGKWVALVPIQSDRLPLS